MAAGPPLGAVDMGGDPVQDRGADRLRTAQGRHHLIIQKPADLRAKDTTWMTCPHTPRHASWVSISLPSHAHWWPETLLHQPQALAGFRQICPSSWAAHSQYAACCRQHWSPGWDTLGWARRRLCGDPGRAARAYLIHGGFDSLSVYPWEVGERWVPMREGTVGFILPHPLHCSLAWCPAYQPSCQAKGCNTSRLP